MLTGGYGTTQVVKGNRDLPLAVYIYNQGSYRGELKQFTGVLPGAPASDEDAQHVESGLFWGTTQTGR